MTTMELAKLRALLKGWAAWQDIDNVKYEYLSPPNLIHRLMVGDVAGGGFGSREPRGLVRSRVHNPIFHRLDRVINELPEKRRETIHCEFRLGGAQKQKADYMGIALPTYKEYLNLAIKQILNDDYVKNLVKSP